MPAEFQKAMDYTLFGLKNTYCFLDDIFIVEKGLEEDYKHCLLNCLKRLDDKIFRQILPNAIFLN